jgi:tetratricopeptide (TPR) repeat protein
MYTPHRVFPLWKLSPGLAAVVGIVAIGLHLLGVFPGRSGDAASPTGLRSRPARPARAPKEAEPPETVAALTAAIRREPGNPDPYLGRAALYFEHKEYDKALADCDQALRLAPNNADAYFVRGCAHYQKDEDDLALADLNEAIRLAPDNADAYVWRGSTLGDRKEFKEALADFERALQLTPENAEAYVGRGKALRDLKQYDRALADFQKATRLEPESPEGYNELAWVWATCPRDGVRNPDLALEHAARACQLSDWQDALCLDTYAAAHAAAGNFEQAVRWQKKALALADDVSKTVLEEMRARLKLYERQQAYVLP